MNDNKPIAMIMDAAMPNFTRIFSSTAIFMYFINYYSIRIAKIVNFF
jgi:hypothetical protein